MSNSSIKLNLLQLQGDPDRRANTNVVNEIKSYEKKHIKQ